MKAVKRTLAQYLALTLMLSALPTIAAKSGAASYTKVESKLDFTGMPVYGEEENDAQTAENKEKVRQTLLAAGAVECENLFLKGNMETIVNPGGHRGAGYYIQKVTAAEGETIQDATLNFGYWLTTSSTQGYIEVYVSADNAQYEKIYEQRQGNGAAFTNSRREETIELPFAEDQTEIYVKFLMEHWDTYEGAGIAYSTLTIESSQDENIKNENTYSFAALPLGEVTAEDIGAIEESNLYYGKDGAALLSPRNGYEEASATWLLEAAEGETLEDCLLTIVGRTAYYNEEAKNGNYLKVSASTNGTRYTLVKEFRANDNQDDNQELIVDLTDAVKGSEKAYVKLQWLVFDAPHSFGIRSVTLTGNAGSIGTKLAITNIQNFSQLPVGPVNQDALHAHKSENLYYGRNNIGLLTASKAGEDAYVTWVLNAKEGQPFEDCHLTLVGRCGYINQELAEKSELRVQFSPDGENYSTITTIKPTEPAGDLQSLVIDLSSQSFGRSQIYVRLYWKSQDDPSGIGLRAMSLVSNAGENYALFTPNVLSDKLTIKDAEPDDVPVEPPLQEEVHYITQSVSLGYDLTLHLWGNVPESYISSLSGTLVYDDVVNKFKLSELTQTEDGLYDMQAELAAAQLTDYVDLTLKHNIIGEVIRKQYSIRDYLVALIKDDYDQETKDLSLELLNMGAWAQKYFDYNASNLANKGYEITPANAVPAESPEVIVDGSVSGIRFYGASVRFLSKAAVRFYFKANGAVDGYTFTVDGTEYTPVAKDGLYYIETAGINPQNMSDVITVNVTDGSNTLSVQYAPIWYFVRSYNKAADDTTKGLMAAAYSYYKEAEEYNHKITQGEVKQPEKTQTDLSAPTAMAAFGGVAVESVPLSEPKDLKITGTSEIETVSVLVGDNDRSYTSRALTGYDSEMTFTLTGVTPNAPAMIDIEEIHQRTDGSIAYLVYVNGTEVFGRTYVPISEGPNHAYFDIGADVVGSTGELTVRLVNKTDETVRFSRIWAISNPEETAKEQGIAKKMDVVLMLNYQPSDLDYDHLAELVKSYQCDNMYNVGLCWEINYLTWGKIKTEEFLNNVLNASMLTGAPLYLGINSWWAGTPDGMDGQGGTWQDVQYQQITYDHNNRDGRGHWQLSTPNEFSNTPWLTMNNDYYNSVRIQRIQETVEYLQLRTAELALAGKTLPAIHLYTENEPFYWPLHWTQYEFNNYSDGVGDFSQWVIEDAAKDGITLDPTDGLSEEETMWMYRNLNTYISEVGAAMAAGLGYNYITVKDGVVQYPTEQMVSDSYSHSPIHAIYPNWDPNQRGWENHVLDSIHFGGEWSVYQNADSSRSLDYLLAYGSYSNINAERAGFPGGFESTDFRVLSQCYAYGLEGVVIYNVLAETDQQNVINASNMGSEPMEVRFFEARPVFESDFSLRTAYAQGSVLTDISGMRWDGTEITPNSQDGGSLTYHIRNVKQYTTGLQIKTVGSFSNSRGRMEILAGTSLDSMQSVGVYKNANQSITINTDLYAASQDLYIQIRVYGLYMTSTQMATLALSKVGIYRNITITNGCTDGSVYTHDQNRIRCQIIAARADTERLMACYLERAGGSLTTQQQKDDFKAAYELYAQGRYGEAFASISQLISQLLPATFVVSGYGQLGTYPVEITADSNAMVTVTLKEISENAVRFSLSSSSDAQITVGLLTESGEWGMQKLENGDWLISAGDVAPSDGKATFQITEKSRAAKQIPSEFEARVLASDSSTMAVRSQDASVTDYCYYALFQFSSDVEIYRGIDGTPKENMAASNVLELKPGDYVQVKRNEMGLVTEVYAWYGMITGTVESVEEMSLTGEVSNPFVTIRAADGTTKRLEIGAESLLHFTGATGEMGKTALVESVGLQVGQQVTVTYCPYTVNERTRVIEITD